jgi:hypothetical protein
MSVRPLLLFMLLLLAAPAAAETLEGSWALKLGGASIFRFDLAKDGEGKWHATWSKPSSFASDGNGFSRLKGPTKQVPSMTALDTPDGIEVGFNDPRPGAVPDIFDFKPIDPDALEMTYVGTDLAPYTLERVKPGAPLGPWDDAATYSRSGAAAKSEVGPVQPAGETPPAAKTREVVPEKAPDALLSIDPGTFRLKPGAPIGR